MLKQGKAYKRAVSKPQKLEPGEKIDGSWIAGIPFERFGKGRLTKTGGTLVLTNRRIFFEPLGTDIPSLPHTGHITTALKTLVKLDRGGALLSELSSAEPVPGKLPQLRINAKTGTSAVFVISEKRTSTPWGDQDPNLRLRDGAVDKINRAINSGR